MTGVGFFEILVIGVVGLLILGPDKLPGALRTMALWIGRFRRSFDDIKRDIEKEIGADDIRRQLRNEAIMDKFQEGKKQITDTVDKAKKQTDSLKSNLDLKQQILDSGKDSDKGSTDKVSENVSENTSKSGSPETKVNPDPTENLAQTKQASQPGELKEPKESNS